MSRAAEAEKRYRELRPEYERYVAKLVGLLGELAFDAHIDVSQVDGRAKSVESFVEKIQRKSYHDPLRETPDLAGLRIITYYHDDVLKMAEIVRSEFEVLPQETPDRLAQLDVDEFGYRSWHLVIRLRTPRSSLAEWKRFATFVAEVQVRSVLQHAWAAISHKLDYKKAAQAPPELRRQLFRLSALLELADEQFASLRDESQAIVARYGSELRAGDLDLPLDLDALREFVDQRVDTVKWEQLANRSGLDPASPGSEADESVNLARLLLTVQTVGLESIAEVAQLLNTITDAEAEKCLAKVAEETRAQGDRLEAVPVDVLTILVSFKRATDLPRHFDWGGQFKLPILAAMRKALLEENGDG